MEREWYEKEDDILVKRQVERYNERDVEMGEFVEWENCNCDKKMMIYR